MTNASCRNRIKALRLGTAIATSIAALAVAGPAFAQNLPDLGATGDDGGATITTGGGNMQIDLGDQNRVINWESYNVGPNRNVNYLTTNTTNQYAVLNRVIVIDPANTSNIDGSVTTLTNSNIVVWLSNPNGILVGGGGSFNTGGLVLTTMPVDGAAFLGDGTPANPGIANGQAFALTGGTNAITVGGTLTTTGTGGLVGSLLLAAPQIAVSGDIAASGAAALVAATDATFSAGIGSPLSVQITKGSAVAGTLIDVDDAGSAMPTISGSSVALVGASDTTVVSSLLNVDAGASLTATAAGGAIVLATKSTGSVTIDTPNGDAIVTNGALSTHTAGGDGGPITIAAAGAATVGGTVTADGDYTVDGDGVTLGSPGNPSSQSAGGALTINPNGAGITLASAVALSSGTGDLTLAGTVDGAYALTLNSAQTTRLQGAVGGSAALASLTTDAPGTTAIGGDVDTMGGQSYRDAVTLGADAVLSSTGSGDIVFGKTVDGTQNLTVTTAGLTQVGGAVGGGSPLQSLTVDGGGVTAINGGSVATVGAQSYGDAVTLGADTTLSGTTGTFSAGVTGNAHGLTLNYTGTTSIDGAFTGIDDLTSGGGGTTELSGTITTAGAQSYLDEVLLTAGTQLSSTGSGEIAFGQTLDGPYALVLNTAGQTRFDGEVGGTSELTSLTTDGTGTTRINGGLVATVAAQSYGDPVVLGADTTLSSSAGGTIRFATTVDAAAAGVQSLTVNTAGATEFWGAVGATAALAQLTTDSAGTTGIFGGRVITTGAQDYKDAVLIADATLTSTGGDDVTFEKTVDGSGTLVVNTAGKTAFLGAVGDTTALNALTTDAAGQTDLNGPRVTTIGAQTYNDDVVLSTDVTLASLADVTFAKTVNSQDAIARALTVNTGATTTFGGEVGTTFALASLTTGAAGTTAINGGVVRTTGAQTYNEVVTLGMDTTLIGGSGTFAGGVIGNGYDLTLTLGGTTALDGTFVGIDDLRSDGGGTTTLAGAITTGGSQSYADPVQVVQDATLTSTGGANVTFETTVDSGLYPHALAVNTVGTTTFGGPVGSNSPLLSLTTNAGGTTAINGGSVVTTGAQTYNDQVTLGADTVLTGSSGSLNAGVVGNNRDLTLNFGGTTAIDGATFTGIRNLATGNGGTTTLIGTISTTETQTYNDAVMLLGATTLTSSGAAAAGNVKFASTLDGAQTLAVNTAGQTIFLGAVGALTPLTSITTDAPGETDLNGGTVTTTGAQTYNDDVVLSADATLNGSAVTFAKTVNSQDATARMLTVNSPGVTTFLGAVGNTFALATLTTDTAGETDLNGGTVTTTGAQTYNDDVVLSRNATLNGGAVTFAKTLNSQDATARTLAVNSPGATTFGGAVGNTFALASLTTDGPGTTAINGGSVRTSGAQSYNDAVTLGGALPGTTLTSLGNGNVTFGSTLDGAKALVVNTGGTTAFLGQVGDTTALASITTDAGGQTDINGLRVTTTGAQTYNDNVVLSADATLSAGAVTFNGTVNSQDATPRALVVNSAGTTTFNDAVGNTNALSLVFTDTPGTTALNGGSVRTTGYQSYGDIVTLGGPLPTEILTSTQAGDIAFRKSVDGARALVVNTAGTTTFDGAVGSIIRLASLTTDAPGTTAINGGSVRTTGNQTYNDGVRLGAATLLDSSGGDVTANGALDGSFDLTVRALAGTAALNGITGGLAPLNSLDISAGTVIVNSAYVLSGASLTSGAATRIGSLSAASILANAGTDLTGLAGASTGTSDANFGRANLTARAGTLNIDAGGLVQLGAGSASGNLTITAGTNPAKPGSVQGGSIDATALSVGGNLSLTTAIPANPADAAHDGEIILGTGSATGNATLTSPTDVRIGTLSAGGASAITITAGNDLTGLAGASVGTSDGNFGRANLDAQGPVAVTVNGLAQLGTVAAGGSLAVTAGTATRDGSIDLTGATAGTSVDLVATAVAPVGDAAHDGDIRIGAGGVTAGTTLLVSNVIGGGDRGSIVATGTLRAAGGDARIDSAVDASVADISTSGSVGLRARGSVIAADITAGEDIGVLAGTGSATLGRLTAGDDVTVTATGPISLVSATTTGAGPDNRRVDFSSPTAIAFTAEPAGQGADIVLTSSGSSVTASGTLRANSDVTVNGSPVSLAAVVADTGNAAVNGGTSATIGLLSAVAGSGTVTAGTVGVGGAVTGGALTLTATTGNLTLGNATVGGDAKLSATSGAITTGPVTAASFNARSATGFTATGAIAAGNAARGADPAGGTNTVDIAVSNGAIAFTDLTATGAGHDVVLSASGAIGGNNVTAARSISLIGNGVTIGTATATAGNVAVSGGSSASIGSLSAVAGSGTVTAGTVAVGGATTGGALTLTATTGNLTLGSATAGGDARLSATSGSITTGRVNAASLNARSSTGFTATGPITAGNAARGADPAGGTNTVDIAVTNGGISFADIAATGAGHDAVLTASGAISGTNLAAARSVTVSGGPVTLGTVTATAGNVTVSGGTAATIAGLTAGDSGTVTAGTVGVGSASTGSALTLTATTGALTVGTASAGTDITLSATQGALTGTSLTANRNVTATGNSVNLGTATATTGNVSVTGTSSATVNALSAAAGTGAVTAGTVNVGGATTRGTLVLTASAGNLSLGGATSGGNVTLSTTGTASVGRVTATPIAPSTTGLSISLSAADAAITGPWSASSIIVTDTGGSGATLRLGEGLAAGGFALSQTEVNLLNAPIVTIDAFTASTGGTQHSVEIGNLALDGDTGSTRLDILGLQRFDITGTISATGPATGTRTLRLGGANPETSTSLATVMRFATTPTAGGRVLVPGVDLELRAGTIGMGLDAGFLDPLGVVTGMPKDSSFAATNYIQRGSSTLYVAENAGGPAYVNKDILVADRLTVKYSNFAVFQNTGGLTSNSGVSIATAVDPTTMNALTQGPNPSAAGGFAMFGTINGVRDSATAVLGDTIISLPLVDRLNARINGCLIGSGSGCIASVFSTPPLPPLNAFRGDIFSTQGDFTTPFDPVVGTNNESLFGDVGSFGLSDLPLQPLECDPDDKGDCAREGQETK